MVALSALADKYYFLGNYYFIGWRAATLAPNREGVVNPNGSLGFTTRTDAKTRGLHEAWRRGDRRHTSGLNRSHGERVNVANRKRHPPH
ncbi:hypothetical protein [Furfurilactobacillus rossiae]|uniref:Uncharacterized protein n=1 Tax=Furfurilactobacillus rossiae DSM 15814 TaxID=1114972 RepID=A0A0R1RRC1_9LACO|nr:hypothetical protein [Furfurilactobacillus rossiae]KRL55768.1 hypothetical protein FD35_GL002298 [Furfurilactobacillus rossiae DSM 15814]QFR67281.1 hypothetical protein LR814_09280 [Furfurilactobacillus rossiae]QLE60208.1 hypothetical protein LROSRS0_0160 [Furfurilactobacillus rossiae]